MNIAINVFYIFPIMLALCLMLSMTHYAQNYAGIIGGSLTVVVGANFTPECKKALLHVNGKVTTNNQGNLRKYQQKRHLMICFMKQLHICASWSCTLGILNTAQVIYLMNKTLSIICMSNLRTL